MADNYRNLNVTANQIEEAVEYVTANKTTINQGLSDVQNNKHDISELQAAISEVYSRSETDNLLSTKANKSNTYTKTETDNKITEKVSEIVSGAPEDFDTLKEMSDWLEAHEDSAATMNSAIQKNKDDISAANEAIEKNVEDISNLNAGKVDKEDGKSLVSDSEITRLAGVDNYDDSKLKKIMGATGKNLCPVNKKSVGSSGGFVLGASGVNQKVDIKPGKVIMSWKGTATTGASSIKFYINGVKVAEKAVDNQEYIEFEVDLTQSVNGVMFYCNAANNVSDIMIRYSDTDNIYEPYQPSLQEQINALTARIAALEGTATTAEGGEA